VEVGTREYWQKKKHFLERERTSLTIHCYFSFYFFFLFLSKISNKKYSNFFIFFILHQLFFIIIQIKKIIIKQNFFIKHFQILYHINHFLLHNTQIFHNPITYQTSPHHGSGRHVRWGDGDIYNPCEVGYNTLERARLQFVRIARFEMRPTSSTKKCGEIYNLEWF
jgi:hypothetical protein